LSKGLAEVGSPSAYTPRPPRRRRGRGGGAGGLRDAPGLLGAHRVVDTVTWLGPAQPEPTAATTYALPDGAGTLARWLGVSLAASPLHRVDVGRATLRPSLGTERPATVDAL